MPGCPVPGCNEECLSEDDLYKHILSKHPDITAPTAGTMREMAVMTFQGQMLSVSAYLTATVFGREVAPKEDVWAVFVWFRSQLRTRL